MIYELTPNNLPSNKMEVIRTLSHVLLQNISVVKPLVDRLYANEVITIKINHNHIWKFDVPLYFNAIGIDVNPDPWKQGDTTHCYVIQPKEIDQW